MEQFIKEIPKANEDKVNTVIAQYNSQGYRAISVASSRNTCGFFTVVVLFEKVK